MHHCSAGIKRVEAGGGAGACDLCLLRPHVCGSPDGASAGGELGGLDDLVGEGAVEACEGGGELRGERLHISGHGGGLLQC